MKLLLVLSCLSAVCLAYNQHYMDRYMSADAYNNIPRTNNKIDGSWNQIMGGHNTIRGSYNRALGTGNYV